MLSLSVRAVRNGSPVHSSFFPDFQEHYCCRTALAYVRRLTADTGFPSKGLACVSVVRFPSQYLSYVMSGKYKIGELVFHAVRYDKTSRKGSPYIVEIPIAPHELWQHLPGKPSRSEPLIIDIRHTDREILPDDIRAMVPDVRLHELT